MVSEVLRVQELSVSIGTASVVKRVSLTVGAGEIVGLVGASGSGKSLTARAIVQLLPTNCIADGIVQLRGRTLTGLSDVQMQAVRGRDLGMIFQDPKSALNPLMRIGDQVAETVRLHGGTTRAAARAAAREALDRVGLSGEAGALDRLPHELSGGQRQRVAIAMSIVMAPALLIADEPTTALDVMTQAQVLALLRDLARSRGMGLLLITHDLAVIAQMTDRVAVMHDGEIVAQDSTSHLHRTPDPYARSLLAAARTRPERIAAPPADAPVVLDVDAVVQDYPRKRRSLFRAPSPLRAVDGVSMVIRAGETVGLVGESGSGKSSLVKVILALQGPSAGRVTLLGNLFAALRKPAVMRLRRDIQSVFQDPAGSFDPRWTVERSVAEPLSLLDEPPGRRERARKVAEALEQVGLNARDALRHPNEFSGGQRQRIAIARALITQPALLVLDEAVSALDVFARGQVLQLLAQLTQRLKVACLFVTHDLHVVRTIANRVYVMRAGRIVEEGDTEFVFVSPQHPYTRALIRAAPALNDSWIE